MNNGVQQVIEFALESTAYLEISSDGLSVDELHEVCRRFDFQSGEISDALEHLCRSGTVVRFFRDPLYRLKTDYLYFTSGWFKFRKHDPRNFQLLDAAVNLIFEEVRRQGAREFSLIIPSITNELRKQANWLEKDVVIGLKILERYGLFKIQDNAIEKPKPMLSKDFVKNIAESNNFRNHEELFYNTKNVVSEILSRRNSNKTVSTDPLVAFSELFHYMGCEVLSGWWSIQVSEYRNLNSKRCCGLALVSIASLCEGALTCCAASPLKEGLTMVKRIPEDTKQWKMPTLVEAACTGSKPLIGDQDLRRRLLELNEYRRIIHAAYFLPNPLNPPKTPDIRPEQVDSGVKTLHKLLRTIIEWVQTQKESQSQQNSFS